MGKGRMEAFSDGVLAIIITIMVLDLHAPAAATAAALAALLPSFLGYLLSFVYVAIYWNNHHHLVHALQRVSGAILWANLHLLFWLSLIPWATRWLGEYPSAVLPTFVYGLILLMAALAYFLLQRLIMDQDGNGAWLRRAIGADGKGKLSLLCYTLALCLAVVAPIAAQGLFVVVALLWLIPDRRIERALRIADEPARPGR